MGEMRMLLLSSVIGGVVFLDVGFLLNLINAWRNKEWSRFFLEKNGLLGIALYWTLLGGGAAVGLGLLPIATWGSVGFCLCLLMWFREPLAAKIWGGSAPPMGDVIVTGFFELFEAVISYISNSLSFIRLGAFAVAHEGLSHMVLLYSGGSAGWLVFLVGTVLIVGFEGIIVGIQALRLEYYEFFGRFFQGTGRPFVPLSFKGGPDATVGVRA
jgi:V/A-type H+-transporting ATPase subunit I